MPFSTRNVLVLVALVGCSPAPAPLDGGTTDAATPPTSDPGGWILLQHGLVRGTIARFYGEGGYYSAVREDRCTQEVLSPECLGIVCRPDAPFANAHPGTITVELEGGATFVAVPDALGEYTNEAADWRTDTLITVSAPGASLGGFTASVRMPGAPPTFAPPPPSVSRSAGLSLAAASSPSSNRVRFEIPSGASTTYPTYVVDCVLPAATTVVVPPEVLAFLPNGEAQLTLEAANRTVIAAAGMRIDVVAANSGPATQEHLVQLVD